MIAINHISMAVALCSLVAVVVGWVHVRHGRSGAEQRLLLLLLYMLGAFASVFASALAVATGRFWLYPFIVGLAIFALTYMHYRIQLSREE